MRRTFTVRQQGDGRWTVTQNTFHENRQIMWVDIAVSFEARVEADYIARKLAEAYSDGERDHITREKRTA